MQQRITGSDQRAVRPLTPRMPERELELAAPYCERRTHVGSVESVPKSLGTADTKRCAAASALRATDRTRERPYARRALFTTLVAPTSYERQHRCQLAATPTSLRLSSKFARGIPGRESPALSIEIPIPTPLPACPSAVTWQRQRHGCYASHS
jgi:hypothetical protein